MRSAQILVLGFLVAFSGCTASPTVVKANAVPARQATDVLPPDLLIDIGISPFDPNIPETEKEQEDSRIVPDVRRAEANYLAYHLKTTLEGTGNWGAVRVTPVDSYAVDLVIDGKILVSDGETLKARVTAVDSMGKEWLDHTYEDTASRYSYRNQGREDPFQDFYNEISNDLLAAREKLSKEQLRTLRRTSSLRFAVSFAPNAFDDYIEKGRNGRVDIVRLPAPNDPMLARVDKVKEREYLVVDTLDEFYAKFYKDMQPSYFLWRETTYEEAMELRRLERDARRKLLGGAALIVGGIAAARESDTYASQGAGAAAVGGGVSAIYAGINQQKQVEIHAAALKETNESLGSELTPIVLDIEGRTVELTGSAAAQYEQWRKILGEIYHEETGL